MLSARCFQLVFSNAKVAACMKYQASLEDLWNQQRNPEKTIGHLLVLIKDLSSSNGSAFSATADV
jgi:hypothetical protein